MSNPTTPVSWCRHSRDLLLRDNPEARLSVAADLGVRRRDGKEIHHR